MKNQGIKELRERRGWSQEHLAKATGISLRTVQRLEAGKRVSKETLLNLAAGLLPIILSNSNLRLPQSLRE